MPTFNNISMTIRIDDVDVTEYMVEENLEKKMVTCWVPSQVGKVFQVIANGTGLDEPWSARVRADGKYAQDRFFDQNAMHNIGFFRKSATVTHPFVFSHVELVDDDNLLHSWNYSKIGEIEIKCFSRQKLEFSKKQNHKRSFNDSNKLHERAKKGVVQYVGLGQPQIEECTFVKSEKKEHLVTFVFRYRSLDFLQAQGIVPHDPTPQRDDSPVGPANHGVGESPKVKDEPTDLTDVDEDHVAIHALQEKLAEIQEQLQEVLERKRKRKPGVGTVSKRVKKEEVKPCLSGEVIDLT